MRDEGNYGVGTSKHILFPGCFWGYQVKEDNTHVWDRFNI
jgi:hypothetical protein